MVLNKLSGVKLSCPNKLWYKEIKSRQRISQVHFHEWIWSFQFWYLLFSLLSKKVHSFIQLTWLYLHVCTIISWRFLSDLTLNPYWRILENSSKNFSEISVSGAWARPFSGKFIHICVMPRNSFNIIFRLNALIWKRFPKIGLCHAPQF